MIVSMVAGEVELTCFDTSQFVLNVANALVIYMIICSIFSGTLLIHYGRGSLDTFFIFLIKENDIYRMGVTLRDCSLC